MATPTPTKTPTATVSDTKNSNIPKSGADTVMVPTILFIAFGILIGSMFSEKASSGISSIIVQLVCFTSGMYFPKEMLGDAFASICEYLPFAPSLTIIKGIMNNTLDIISIRNIIIFLSYTIVIFVISVMVFKKKMVGDNK